MSSTFFVLHSQLAADSFEIGDLDLSRVLLSKDANFPWLILVPRRPDVCEIVDLSQEDQLELMREIAWTSEALRRITGCDKLNVAALGNMVPQLHVHIIARFHSDPAWPKPIWGQVPARPYDTDSAGRLASRLRSHLFT